MDRREGVMTEWNYEGVKSSEVFYKRNYKVGIKKYFDHKGKVTFTQEFKMDISPVMIKMLKDERKDAPKEECMR